MHKTVEQPLGQRDEDSNGVTGERSMDQRCGCKTTSSGPGNVFVLE